jgi:hypothetical protein
VSIVASFAAREVFVSTMGTIYGVGGTDDALLQDKLRSEVRADGTPAYTPLIAVGLMVFYVYALMCMSTIAVTVREAGGGRLGWKWAGVQFGYMLALAYGAAWLTLVTVGRALGYRLNMTADTFLALAIVAAAVGLAGAARGAAGQGAEGAGPELRQLPALIRPRAR